METDSVKKVSKTHSRMSRSKIACLKCRQRKVRCDVARHGSPCMNCTVDRVECVILDKGARGKTLKELQHHYNLQPAARQKSKWERGPNGMLASESDPAIDEAVPDCLDNAGPDQNEDPNNRYFQLGNQSHIPFAAYAFVKSPFTPSIGQRDIQYLESQGCLHLPVMSLLDELLREYFLHMHPLLPFLSETGFWEIYENKSTSHGNTISLFLLQTMLFASCTFTSQSTIRALGFTDTKEARAAFYRRAKLLYQLESEDDTLSVSQGTLLLSLWGGTPTSDMNNSGWLSISIQAAHKLGASDWKKPYDQEHPTFLNLKRLWWCCLIRDRIIAMSFYRPIQITHHDPRLELRFLSVKELEDDILSSKVYTRHEKRILLDIFVSLCNFCCAITNSLLLISSAYGRNDTVQETINVLDRSLPCKRSLKLWHNTVIAWLNNLDPDTRSSDLVILYANLLEMYYHSILMSIHNIEIFYVASGSVVDSQSREIMKSGTEVEASLEAVVDSLLTLTQRELAKYLPKSGVMCTLWPYILGRVQSESSAGHNTEQNRERERRLNALVKVLKLYSSHYDNTDVLSDVIRHILSSQLPRHDGKRINPVSNIISKHPFFYTHIVQVVTFFFSRGQHPRDSEPKIGIHGRFQPRHESEIRSSTYSCPNPSSSTDTSISQYQRSAFDLDDASKFKYEFVAGLDLDDNSMFRNDVDGELELPELPDSLNNQNSVPGTDDPSLADYSPQANSDVRDPPYLRDIFDLCRDYDIEGILQCL